MIRLNAAFWGSHQDSLWAFSLQISQQPDWQQKYSVYNHEALICRGCHYCFFFVFLIIFF